MSQSRCAECGRLIEDSEIAEIVNGYIYCTRCIEADAVGAYNECYGDDEGCWH